MGIYDILFWLSLGICQEFVFRGWSFNAFSKVISRKNAVILSSIFFAVSHWFAYFWRLGMFGVFDFGEFIRTTIFTFLFGVGMCLIPLKTENKSIIPCIILHSFWDLLAFCY
jgi:membrane protease YdiL (CAAX protease family)